MAKKTTCCGVDHRGVRLCVGSFWTLVATSGLSLIERGRRQRCFTCDRFVSNALTVTNRPWHTRLRCKGICCWFVWRPHWLDALMVHTKTCLETVPIVWLLVSLILVLPEQITAPASSSLTRAKGQPPAQAPLSSAGLTQRACELTASVSPEATLAPVPAFGTAAK